MEADLEVLLVHVNAQVAVIVVVILGEDEMFHLRDAVFAFEISNIGAGVRLHGGLSLLRPDQRIDVMAAVAGNDKGNVDFLAAEVDDACVTLVVMGMGRQECVRVNAFLMTDRIDLLEHDGAAAMIAAGAA
jgi:hypothetical protein